MVQLKSVYCMDFDKRIADKHDNVMQKVASTESEHLDAYHSLARPYRRGYHLSPELSWILNESSPSTGEQKFDIH